MSKTKLSSLAGLIPFAIVSFTLAVFLLMILSGGMRRVIFWNFLSLVPPIVGLLGLIFSVVRTLIRKQFDKVVISTGIASIAAILPALTMVFPMAYPASLRNTTPSVTVRLPADVPLTVAWGGDTLKVNYHISAPDQRWAYDFVVDPYFTGSLELTDYGCYGVPVVAPGSGFVSSAHDGEPDMLPGQASNNYAAPEGNYVVIQLDETGTYLVIAHLKPGSVTVTAGQRVDEGYVIGQCGNSGNTSEPHIHIHHQRQDPSVYPINFAEGLPLYFRDQDGPSMPEGGFEMVNGIPVATGATVVNLKIP